MRDVTEISTSGHVTRPKPAPSEHETRPSENRCVRLHAAPHKHIGESSRLQLGGGCTRDSVGVGSSRTNFVTGIHCFKSPADRSAWRCMKLKTPNVTRPSEHLTRPSEHLTRPLGARDPPPRGTSPAPRRSWPAPRGTRPTPSGHDTRSSAHVTRPLWARDPPPLGTRHTPSGHETRPSAHVTRPRPPYTRVMKGPRIPCSGRTDYLNCLFRAVLIMWTFVSSVRAALLNVSVCYSVINPLKECPVSLLVRLIESSSSDQTVDVLVITCIITLLLCCTADMFPVLRVSRWSQMKH